MRLFGFGKKKTTEGPQEGIIQMKATLEMLEKKEKHLDSKIEAETEIARQNASKNKSLAMIALKRRKMYETQREHTRGARYNLETQLMSIENAHINVETLNSMKVAAQTLKGIQKLTNVDQVEDIMDEVREQMDIANEISTSISNPLNMDMMVDEDDLEAELEQFEQEEMDAKLLDVQTPINNIKQPQISKTSTLTTSPVLNSSCTINDEDAELEELRASMAL
jgi:charged multivesicular body protein 4